MKTYKVSSRRKVRNKDVVEEGTVEAEDIHAAAKAARKMFPKAHTLNVEGQGEKK